MPSSLLRRPQLRRAAVAAMALTVVTGLAGCGSSAPDDETASNDELVFNIGSAVDTVVMSPYTVVPETEGYWEEAGVDVAVQNANGSTAALQLLLAGKADIVISGTDTTYTTALKNPELRIVSLVTENVWRIAASQSSPITSIEDLRGKTIGVHALTSGTYTYGRSIVQAAGLDPDKDVEWLPIGTGTQAAQAINSGRVDAYSSYDGPLDLVSATTDEPLEAIPSKLDDVPGSLGYVTTKEVLKERRDDLVAFLKGTYQGMAFGQADPNAAIRIYWNEFPDQKPQGSETKALADARASVKNSWSNRFAPGDNDLVGYLDPASVQAAADFFSQYQIVEGDIPDLDTVVDLSLNKAANDFDEAAVAADAAAVAAEAK